MVDIDIDSVLELVVDTWKVNLASWFEDVMWWQTTCETNQQSDLEQDMADSE